MKFKFFILILLLFVLGCFEDKREIMRERFPKEIGILVVDLQGNPYLIKHATNQFYEIEPLPKEFR